jgi:hypothetical protein
MIYDTRPVVDVDRCVFDAPGSIGCPGKARVKVGIETQYPFDERRIIDPGL